MIKSASMSFMPMDALLFLAGFLAARRAGAAGIPRQAPEL
jgi:hypothetical protein